MNKYRPLNKLNNLCISYLATNVLLEINNGPLNSIQVNNINQCNQVCQPLYQSEVAKFLLQLSIHVTNCNYLNIDHQFSNVFEVFPLHYTSCPNTKFQPILSKIKYFNSGSSNLGYILYHKSSNQLFVVFTGTSNSCLGTLDLNFDQVELSELLNYTPGIRGHSGIYAAYLSIRQELLNIIKPYLSKVKNIIITGHSLGGAISNLCAFDLAYYNPIHYSFASPLTYNILGANEFKNMVDTSYCIFNLSDLVALSPFPIMNNRDTYNRVGQVYTFDQNYGNYADNHSLAYLDYYQINI